MEHLDQILKFLTASDEEKDYSIIGTFTAGNQGGCLPALWSLRELLHLWWEPGKSNGVD